MMEVNDLLVHNSLRLLGQGAWTDIYLIWINLFSFLLFVFTHTLYVNGFCLAQLQANRAILMHDIFLFPYN